MKILLAVDGSKYSRWAVDLLLGCPWVKEPEMIVLHVVDIGDLTHPVVSTPLAFRYSEVVQKEIQRSLDGADRIVHRTAEQVKHHYSKVQTLVLKGRPAEQIVRFAGEEKVDLIVMGSHGVGAIKAFMMGRVSQKVATYAPCSVLIARRRVGQIRRVLLAVDGSVHSRAAVSFIQEAFIPSHLQAFLLHVWDYPFGPSTLRLPWLERQYQKRFVQAGFKVTHQVIRGHAAQMIIREADRRKVDLVVVGSRGLTGLKRFLLGGVSHKVMKYCHRPVLIVRSFRASRRRR